MAHRGPTLINLPPPPSDPVTPSEMGPGTPNSTTTSMSTLSVVAIKDGARGHGGHGPQYSANTLDAERADRISRLAGLERVTASRGGQQTHLTPGGTQQAPAYFDAAVPHIKERSTVGSASATGSVGGKTTWASESMDMDTDKMSEDPDDGVSSTGGFSDEDKASLVGFGEGAGSTVSGPVSTATARALAARHNYASPSTPRSGIPTTGSGQSTPMSGIISSGAGGHTDPKYMDGVSYDQSVVDTTMQSPFTQSHTPQHGAFAGLGSDAAEHIMRNRLGDTQHDQRPVGNDGLGLGKFPFEK